MALVQLLLVESLTQDLQRFHGDASAIADHLHLYESCRECCRTLVMQLGMRWLTEQWLILWEALTCVVAMCRDHNIIANGYDEQLARRYLPGPWRLGDADEKRSFVSLLLLPRHVLPQLRSLRDLMTGLLQPEDGSTLEEFYKTAIDTTEDAISLFDVV